VFSADVLTLAAYETVKICVPTILDGWLGRVSARKCDQRLDSWSRNLVRLARITIDARGRENLVAGESFVVMSNHQSHFDIPVVFQALGIPIRMVAKQELFRIPVMGSAMRYSGFVEVDRSRRAKAVRSLSAARARLQSDQTSVWIAPEGTRSLDGQLGTFKRGGFHLAMDAGLRILPIAVDGTLHVLRSKETQVHKGRTVRVLIRPPVDVQSYTRTRTDELVATVRATIVQALEESAAEPLSKPRETRP